MKEVEIFIALIVCYMVVIMLSCEHSQIVSDPYKEWKLGWRMMFNENDSIANVQFDSLLQMNSNPDFLFVMKGLVLKQELGLKEEIKRIIPHLDSVPYAIQVYLGNIDKDTQSEKRSSSQEETVENPELQRQLAIMNYRDQAVRGHPPVQLEEEFNIDLSKDLHFDGNYDLENGVTVDRINRERLKEIIAEYGFPTQSLVGNVGMSATFLIIQHGDMNPEWQREMLDSIKIAVEKGDMSAERYAYLYDRVMINADKKQLYGTQVKHIDTTNKKVEFFPIEDSLNVNRRRMEKGMMPIEVYATLFFSQLH